MNRLLLFLVLNIFLTLSACGGGGGGAGTPTTVGASENQLLLNQLTEDVQEVVLNTTSVSTICQFSDEVASLNARVAVWESQNPDSSQTPNLVNRFHALISVSVSQITTENVTTSAANLSEMNRCLDQISEIATARSLTQPLEQLQVLTAHVDVLQEDLTEVTDANGASCIPAVLDSCNVCNGPGRVAFFEDTDADTLGELTTLSRCAAPTGFVSNQSDPFISNVLLGTDAPSLRFGSGMNTAFLVPFDFDGDGDIDILHHNPTRDFDVVMVNQGSNSYVAQDLSADNSSYFGDSESSGRFQSMNFQVIDFDGDNDDDIVVAEAFKDAVLLVNDGGSFSHIYLPSGGLSANPTTNNAYSNNSVLADLDADGDLDVVDVHNTQITLWKNTSGATITATTAFTGTNLAGHNLTQLLAADIQVVDLNGDTFPEIVVLAESTLKVYKNNCTDPCTTATFTAVVAETGLALDPGFTSERLYIHDMNGDNKKDILLIARDKILQYTNTSVTAAQFSTATEIFDAPESLTHLSIVDMDGDNDLDIVTTYPQFRKVVLLTQDSGGYTETIIKEDLNLSISVLAIDSDDDGDIDVLSATSTGLFTHHLRIR